MSVNQEFIRTMRNKYQSYLKPSGEVSDIISGKDVDQYGPAEGFTGRGPMDQPAGVVHGGEYVVNAGDVQNLGGPGGVRKALDTAQTQPQTSKFDPSKNPMKNLSLGARGPQALPPRPSRASEEKTPTIGAQERRVPGFQTGGGVVTHLEGGMEAAPGTNVQIHTPTGVQNVRYEPPDYVDPADRQPPPYGRFPGDENFGTYGTTDGTKTPTTTDKPDSVADFTPKGDIDAIIKQGEEFRDTMTETLEEIDPVVAPEPDERFTDLDNMLISIDDFGDLDALPPTERNKFYEEIENQTADRYGAIARGDDPVFQRLSEREKESLAGVLNARRGKQSQIAMQMGLSGGELNAHFATTMREQELQSLGLRGELAKLQMDRIDHANDQLMKMSADGQAREELKRQWGSEFNLKLANFGLDVADYNRLVTEWVGGYLKDYAQMGMDADRANQTAELTKATIMKDVESMIAMNARWGVDVGTKWFLENRGQHLEELKILMNLNTPESLQSSQSLIERYFPEFGDITSNLIESAFNARFGANMADFITGIQNESFDEVSSAFDTNGELTADAIGKDYVKSAIKMWNAHNELKEGDEGYIDPNDYNALKSNSAAFKWVNEKIHAENTKRTVPYLLTKDFRPEEVLALVDDFAFINDKGEIETKFNSLADLDEFEFNGTKGIEGVKMWYAEAFKNNVISKDANGDLVIEDQDPLMSAWGLEGLSTVQELETQQASKFSSLKGWPATLDKNKKIVVKDNISGDTETFVFGQEIPVGEQYTYGIEGTSTRIDLDKDWVSWRTENPDKDLGGLAREAGVTTAGASTGTPTEGEDTPGSVTSGITSIPPDLAKYMPEDGSVVLDGKPAKITDEKIGGLTYAERRAQTGATHEQLLNDPQYAKYFEPAYTETVVATDVGTIGYYTIDKAKLIDGKTYDEIQKAEGLNNREMFETTAYRDFFKESDTVPKPDAVENWHDVLQLGMHYTSELEAANKAVQDAQKSGDAKAGIDAAKAVADLTLKRRTEMITALTTDKNVQQQLISSAPLRSQLAEWGIIVDAFPNVKDTSGADAIQAKTWRDRNPEFVPGALFVIGPEEPGGKNRLVQLVDNEPLRHDTRKVGTIFINTEHKRSIIVNDLTNGTKNVPIWTTGWYDQD